MNEIAGLVEPALLETRAYVVKNGFPISGGRAGDLIISFSYQFSRIDRKEERLQG
jgi:hypothetical protein